MKYTVEQLDTIAQRFNRYIEQDGDGNLVWANDLYAENGWTPFTDEQRAEIDELVGRQQAYEVTAANRYFYQRLVVLAPNRQEAWLAFWDFLRGHEQQVEEEEEYEMAVDAFDGDNDDAPVREDYVYKFRDEDITEFTGDHRWTGTPTGDVQVMAANGNG